MKKLLLLIQFMFLFRTSYAQFEQVEKFPDFFSNFSISRGFLYDVGEEHLLFFFGSDSMYISNSYDNGTTWQTPLFLSKFGSSGNIDVETFEGKLFALLPTHKILTSEDNGSSWNSYQLPLPTTKYLYIKHNSSLYYVFINHNPVIYYTSLDGENWNSTQNSFSLPDFDSFAFMNFEQGNYKIAYSYRDNNDGLYKIKIVHNMELNDNWISDGDIFVAPRNKKIGIVRSTITPDGKYWILFTIDNYTEEGQNYDIYYMYSQDEGVNWNIPQFFAKSFSDDILESVSASLDYPLVSFNSLRNSSSKKTEHHTAKREKTKFNKNSTKQNAEYYFGKAGLSLDNYIKPYVYISESGFTPDYSSHILSFYVNAKIYSWNELTSIQVVGGNNTYTMYDDGNHNDGVAGDSIYGTGNFTINVEDSISFSIIVSDVLSNVYSSKIYQVNFLDQLSDDLAVIKNGQVCFSFNNSGVLGNIQPIRFDSRSAIYAGGFLLSGYSNGQLWANGMFPSSRIEDYISGSCEDNGVGKIYYVKSSDPAFGESWQTWSEAVAKGARFYDGNSDGVYTPVDLNENGVWDENEDAPEMQGTITAWCVYNDGVPAYDRMFSDVSPLGIEIRQTVWTRKYAPELQNIFFVRYSIYNTGTVSDELDSIYFSVATDADIGDYLNDIVGSSPDLLTGYTYDDGNDWSYGSNAPAVLTTYLDARRYPSNILYDFESLNTSFVHFFNGYPTQSDPSTKEELRNYSLGMNQVGIIVDPCNWEFGTVAGGADCSTIDGRWMYSGNPVDSVGWINTFPNDQRTILSTGPFSINSGECVDITLAYHFERGETSLGSVSLGLAKAQYLRDNALILGTDDEIIQKPKKFALSQNYPNPFSKISGEDPTTTIRYSIAKNNVNVTLKIYDVLGREVCSLVNAKQNIGNYSVKFNASNLASGIYFYRLQAGKYSKVKKMILMK